MHKIRTKYARIRRKRTHFVKKKDDRIVFRSEIEIVARQYPRIFLGLRWLSGGY